MSFREGRKFVEQFAPPSGDARQAAGLLAYQILERKLFGTADVCVPRLIAIYAEEHGLKWSDETVEQVYKGAYARFHKKAADNGNGKLARKVTFAKPAVATVKKAERFPNKKGTWADIAQKEGLSTRRIKEIAANGVMSRALAERLAPSFGCEPDELLKGLVRRGRRPTYVKAIMRLGREFTFKQFVIETDEAIALDNPQFQLFFELAAGYEEHRPPAVFASSEEFQTFAQAAMLPGADSVREMAAVWKAYKAWVVDRVAERAREAIATEEPDPDEEFH
jgi:hypothetical protein